MPDDFVDIMLQLTNFVQNERVASYNEGVDSMLASVRGWIREHRLDPSGDNIPDMLDDFLERYKRGEAFTPEKKD